MRSRVLLLVLASTLLSGCATEIGVTYRTQPAGAMIAFVDGSQQIGLSPVRVTYTWDERYVTNGCLRTKGVAAQWASGARSTSPEILTVCGKSGEFTYDLARPANAPGLDKDMQFALEVERTRIMQQQAQAAQQQADMQMMQMFNAMQPKTTSGTIMGPQGTYFYQQTTSP